MKLSSVRLQNFRCFEDTTIHFHEQLTVLVGGNGSGKSSILDALKIALWPYISGFDLGNQTNIPTGIDVDDVHRISTANWQMEPVLPSSIETEITIDKDSYTTKRYRESIDKKTKTKDINGTSKLKTIAQSKQKIVYSKNIQESSQLILPVLGYYGTGRLWSFKNLTEGKKSSAKDSRAFGYRDALDPASSYKNFSEWYGKQYKAYQMERIALIEHQERTQTDTGDASRRLSTLKENVDRLEQPIHAVQHAVNSMLEKHVPWTNISYSVADDGIVLESSSGERLKTSQLSDGIRNIIAMTSDIAYRCYCLNTNQGKNAPLATMGIVFIDEIDMHLHPSWQQRVLPDLMRTFPNTQFIVTTHSPQVISSVKPENVCILKNGLVVSPEYSTYGAESSRVLDEIFGVSTRIDDVRSELDAYFRMINNGQHDSPEAQELRAKLENWLYNDPALTRADMLIERMERRKAREGDHA